MKNKMLYLMHVPWAWIKQRPHFFAEYLNIDFDLKVFYKKPLKVPNRNLIQKSNEIISISSFFIIPFQRLPFFKRFKNFEIINNFLIKLQLPSIEYFDFVWITSWSMYTLIEKKLPLTTKLIFDCMDDELEFPDIKINKNILSNALSKEREIMKRADVVFCSSEYLKNKILLRSGVKREIIVVNNGIGIPIYNELLNYQSQQVLNKINELENVFLYVGSVSSWFDFESLLFVLEKDIRVNFVLLGPSDIKIPNHERLHHLGVVDRDDLFKLIKNVKCLIMPFKLNELIKSVNPVKIYEYIHMNKPIIATRYMETEVFSDYIYLYNGKVEFLNNVTGIINEKLLTKKSLKENRNFTIQNTWEVRYKLVQKSL